MLFNICAMTALFRVFQHHDQQRPGISLLKCLAESNRARLRRDAPFSGVAAIHLRRKAQASGVKPASRNMGQGRRIFSKEKRSAMNPVFSAIFR